MATGLTPTAVLRHIKKQIGAIPYEPELNDEDIMQIVFQTTLPVFSKYFPYRFRVIVQEKDAVVQSSNTYILPDIDGLNILGVSKVNVGAFYGYEYNSGMVAGRSNPYDNQILNDYRSMTQTPTTWHFIPPNHIEILPRLWIRSNAMVTLKAVHPKHLKTIKESLREEFLQLATYDVLEALYPFRKRFESISSPYGEIALFLDQVERAHDERAQLLEKFHDQSLRDADAPKLFIA